MNSSRINKKVKIGNTYPLTSPIYMKGPVVHGFGRGSKLIGIPTANIPIEDYREVLESVEAGVYVGWANVSRGEVYKTVLSIGWNPFFNNKEKTIEPYLLHDFDQDFYDQELRMIVTGFLRPESNFPSLDSLIEEIKNDIKIADQDLEKPEYTTYRNDKFFVE